MVERSAEETTESSEGAAFAHGSLGRLAPTWWEPEEGEPEPEPWLTPDAALDRFLDWTAARGIELWPHQEEALMDLMVGDHVILGTPTGSGKSLGRWACTSWRWPRGAARTTRLPSRRS